MVELSQKTPFKFSISCVPIVVGLFVFFQLFLREVGLDLTAKISPKCIVILKA